ELAVGHVTLVQLNVTLAREFLQRRGYRANVSGTGDDSSKRLPPCLQVPERLCQHIEPFVMFQAAKEDEVVVDARGMFDCKVFQESQVRFVNALGWNAL